MCTTDCIDARSKPTMLNVSLTSCAFNPAWLRPYSGLSGSIMCCTTMPSVWYAAPDRTSFSGCSVRAQPPAESVLTVRVAVTSTLTSTSSCWTEYRSASILHKANDRVNAWRLSRTCGVEMLLALAQAADGTLTCGCCPAIRNLHKCEHGA